MKGPLLRPGAGAYLNERSPTGAHNVLAAIRRVIAEIALHPLASQRTSDPEIRVKILGRYSYKIFYAVLGGGTIEIVHVRHTARQPWP